MRGGPSRRVNGSRCPSVRVRPAGRPTGVRSYDGVMKSSTRQATGSRRLRALPVVGVLALVAAGVAIPLSGMSTGRSLELLGIPDPGVLTTAGLPALRAAGEFLCAVAVGTAFFTTFLTPPQKDRTLDVDGYRSQRVSAWANTAWAICAALLIPLTLSDVSGRPLSATLAPAQWLVAGEQIDVASSLRWAALFALVAAVGQRLTVSWRWSVVWLVVSGLSVLPIAATGHASSSGAHDMATNSLIYHLAASVVYVGGLVALIVHCARGGGRVALALRRYSVVATVAIVVLGLSGIVNALVRLAPSDLFSSTYGLVVLAKALCLALLAVFGLAVRRRIIAHLDSRSPAARVDVATLLRIAGTESVVMAGTIALAVSLGRTPPPPPREERAAPVFLRERGAGRPTKRDRRRLDRLKDGRIHAL